MMASGNSLMHWLDSLPPAVLGRMEQQFLELQHSQLENAKEKFDEVQRAVELTLGLRHLVADKLALKLFFELKRCSSQEDASWFMHQRIDRAGHNHFGSILNLAILNDIGNDLCKPSDCAERLLNIANRENDPVKQLLAIVFICKNHEQEKNYEKARSVYDKIGDLVIRVCFVKSCSKLNEERRYYYVTACEELAFLHMKQGKEDLRVASLREALRVLDIDKNQLDWSMQIETLLIRALKCSRLDREQVTKQCGILLSKIISALTQGTINHFFLKYGKYTRGAYMEVATTLKAIDNRSLVDIGDKLFRKLAVTLGDTHHEVILVAALLANQYYQLGKEKLSLKFARIAENVILHEENVQAVAFAKLRTAKLLCTLYHTMRRPEAAETYCLEELRLNSKIYGDRHYFVANNLQMLSYLYRTQGKRDEALVCLQECLEMIRECQPNLTVRHEEIERQIKAIECHGI